MFCERVVPGRVGKEEVSCRRAVLGRYADVNTFGCERGVSADRGSSGIAIGLGGSAVAGDGCGVIVQKSQRDRVIDLQAASACMVHGKYSRFVPWDILFDDGAITLLRMFVACIMRLSSPTAPPQSMRS